MFCYGTPGGAAFPNPETLRSLEIPCFSCQFVHPPTVWLYRRRTLPRPPRTRPWRCVQQQWYWTGVCITQKSHPPPRSWQEAWACLLKLWWTCPVTEFLWVSCANLVCMYVIVSISFGWDYISQNIVLVNSEASFVLYGIHWLYRLCKQSIKNVQKVSIP